ncbi:hypothetical protein BCR43DRAFT_483852 [Syncephalastrum racemosum]|uniref:Uncharacterized protein n=1 Tax=Syncephalastrum racemosum TaxID=13706 RepID=A0A1X2HVX5_SYNRA|nr:hypothetical protein BCR43DRAFT_483852 [Syncephalastrum racemosum]
MADHSHVLYRYVLNHNARSLYLILVCFLPLLFLVAQRDYALHIMIECRIDLPKGLSFTFRLHEHYWTLGERNAYMTIDD